MPAASREFQVFAKPGGSACNLNCRYCYYLNKRDLPRDDDARCMPGPMLEAYIARHIDACPGKTVRFSWHGGEPTVLGLEYFRKIVSLQRKHRKQGQRIENGMQTNGTLLDADWCRFLAGERFSVGISIDGPPELHDAYRHTKNGNPTHERVMNGYALLRKHSIPHDILCVVNAENVRNPIRVYRFFKEIGARTIGFLPLVEPQPATPAGVSPRSVPAEAWGDFLCAIFDEWVRQDIGSIKVQIFEEAASTAFGREHALCIFRRTCGDIPVVEKNGDFYACDHFVDAEHRFGNVLDTPLSELLDSPAQRAFGQQKQETLPAYCRKCEVLEMCNGECPKNRFALTPDGEPGLNYLCAGYQRFFTHCRPFVDQVAALWHEPNIGPEAPEGRPRQIKTRIKTGRNDPCPCGSGRKYKKCCLGKPNFTIP